MDHIILDTTFVLPLFGIEISNPKGIKESLPDLLNPRPNGYKIIIPNTCLLEVMHYLNREHRNTNDESILERYSLIIPTITNSKYVQIVNPLEDQKIMEIGNKLRFEGHSDLLDCWIAATAIHLNGIFLTVDKELAMRIKSLDEFKSTKIWSWKDYLSYQNK